MLELEPTHKTLQDKIIIKRVSFLEDIKCMLGLGLTKCDDPLCLYSTPISPFDDLLTHERIIHNPLRVEEYNIQIE